MREMLYQLRHSFITSLPRCPDVKATLSAIAVVTSVSCSEADLLAPMVGVVMTDEANTDAACPVAVASFK